MVSQTRIGIIGSGFIARGLIMALENQPDLRVTSVLTRSKIRSRTDFPAAGLLTNSIDTFIEDADLVVECSGDVRSSTEFLESVMRKKKAVITMNAELQVTTGSYFARKGYITEAEGDQPGCLAALNQESRQMGFQPLVYGNVKGFLNHDPNPEDMAFWAKKQGISIDKTVAFTDGTKIQIEQALVANGLNAGIAREGMLGISADDVQSGGSVLAKEAKTLGYPISDYVLSPKSPAGVFIVAEHQERVKPYLIYYKLGEGPYYTLLRNYHLCHFEILKTIRQVLRGDAPLLNNSVKPRISVAAIAKKDFRTGDRIRRGIGSFEIRGIAVRIAEHPGHIPVGLVEDVVVTSPISRGQMLTVDDVTVPESRALRAWEYGIKGAGTPP
jgi:predicted homoserine dehydrogenase-like protein